MKTWKLMLVVGCLLGIGSVVDLAQAEVCECICIVDYSCSDISGCSSGIETGCVSSQFTAECDGQYDLKYDFSCSGAKCKSCYVCVFVKDEDGEVIGVCHSTCEVDHCDEVCNNVVTLKANLQYTLFACLRSCANASCEECSGCSGRAQLYKHEVDCASVVCP